jgi:hypothetical protein
MSTIADYQGRTIDVLAFQPKERTTELAQALAADGSGGLICTGIQKLSQRWVLEFLTPVGSIPYLTTRGCAFIAQLRSGIIRTEMDVAAFFYSSASQVAVNLITEDRDTDPSDERYSNVSLEGFSITGDRNLVLNVLITSVAGTTREVILPISVSAGLV